RSTSRLDGFILPRMKLGAEFERGVAPFPDDAPGTPFESMARPEAAHAAKHGRRFRNTEESDTPGHRQSVEPPEQARHCEECLQLRSEVKGSPALCQIERFYSQRIARQQELPLRCVPQR